MNKNKGIIGIGLILAIILGIAVVGGGAYYLGKSGSKPVVINPENVLPNVENQNLPVDNSQQVNVANPTADNTSVSTKNSVSTAISNPISVNGMSKYTDPQFGFSFWYPSDLKVSKTTVTKWNDVDIQDASVIANIDVGDINIKEVSSTTRTISANIKFFGKVTYFFDKNLHEWMTSSENKPTLTQANINDNTMGGLHIFPGVTPYNTVIIPLSANNFLVIGDQQQDDRVPYIARTVVAEDPKVGVVESTDIQMKTIQAVKNIFDMSKNSVLSAINTFVDPLNGFSFQYSKDIGRTPEVYITKNKTNIDLQGCYVVSEAEGNGTNDKNTSINNISYCVSEYTDCGAGTCGTEHYYSTPKNNAYITIGYITFTHNCGATDDEAACKQEQSTNLSKVMNAINTSLGSLKFIQ